VDQDVETAPCLLDRFEHTLEVGVLGDIGRHDQWTVDAGRQVSNALFDALALERKGQFRAFASQRLSDSPRNAAPIGDTENQAAAAV
jgi:hypothetical protein